MDWHIDLSRPRAGDTEVVPKPDEVLMYQVRGMSSVTGDPTAFTFRVDGPLPTELYQLVNENGEIVAEVYPDDWKQERDGTWFVVVTV